MVINKVNADHLPIILGWWASRPDQGEMPDGILPPLGFVAIDEHGPAAAAFVYVPEGVPLVILDWMVGRPGMSPITARAACRAVFAAIEEDARTRGCTRILITTSMDSMAREAQNLGFFITAPHSIHLTKIL